MRALLLATCCALAIGVAAADEALERAGRIADMQLRRYYGALKLSAEARTALRAKLVEHEQQMERDRAKWRARFEAMLTPAQRKQHAKMVHDSSWERQRRGEFKRDSGKLARFELSVADLSKSLDLSAEQQASIEQALKPALGRVDRAASESYLDGWDGVAWFAFGRELQKVYDREVYKRLDYEQKAAFDAIRRKRDAKQLRHLRLVQNQQRDLMVLNARHDTTRERGLVLGEILARLQLPLEEQAVIQPLIEAVLQHKLVAGERLRQVRFGLADAQPEAIAAYRQQRSAWRKGLETRQARLRELLTEAQERVMVAWDVLD